MKLSKFAIRSVAAFSLLFLAHLAQAAVTMPFSLPWMNPPQGVTTYTSADHPSGVFVIEAYFKNCPYCRENVPNINKLAEDYKNQPRVQVLDVGVDRFDSDYTWWINFAKPNHPVLKDAQRILINQLGTQGYPSTYILDCRGNMVWWHEGSFEFGTAEEIRQVINTQLAKTCP